jgi:antitoxin YefM
MTTEALRTVRDHFTDVVDRVESQHERVMVTRNGKPAAVIISADDLAELEEHLEILSDPDAMAEIREGRDAYALLSPAHRARSLAAGRRRRQRRSCLDCDRRGADNDPVDSDMMITIAGIDFNYHDYDERGDVLYLHVGPPESPPAKALEMPEGHTVEYDEHGAIIGLELMGVRCGLERDGELQLTWPPAHPAASALQHALAA